MLPEALENPAKGGPQGNFSIGYNLKSLRNYLILLHISCTFHISKPFDAVAHGSPTMNYSTQVTFGLRKHAIQQGQKNFAVLSSFETYGGFTPLTSQISMHSFFAAEKCLLNQIAPVKI